MLTDTHHHMNQQSFMLRYAPAFLVPYIRLARIDRPIGFWLVVLPSWWGIALASLPHLPSGWDLLLYAVGGLLMRSAGCVCNDLTDQRYDAQVKRTQTRPLVDGSLSRKQALIFLMVLLAMAAAILFQLNPATIIIGIVAVIMTVIYPWMKRITFWPQAFLGLTFNLGTLMGWTLVRGHLELAPIILYMAAFFWTLHYDTIYAHQDKEDDQLIGIRSTALKLGVHTLLFLVFCATCFAILMTGVGILLHLSVSYFILMSIATAFIFYQGFTVDFNQPQACLRAFKQTQWVGWLMFAGILLGR
jgi:4-hydroxybenzoate polyprenyltransferase